MHTLEGHTNDVNCVAFDGTAIVSGSGNDKTVRIWRAPYNTAECERVIGGHTAHVLRLWLCTTPNRHIIVSGDINRRVHVHDIRTGDRVGTPIEFVDCKLS